MLIDCYANIKIFLVNQNYFAIFYDKIFNLYYKALKTLNLSE